MEMTIKCPKCNNILNAIGVTSEPIDFFRVSSSSPETIIVSSKVLYNCVKCGISIEETLPTKEYKGSF